MDTQYIAEILLVKKQYLVFFKKIFGKYDKILAF